MTGTGRAIVSTPAMAHRDPTIFPHTPTGLQLSVDCSCCCCCSVSVQFSFFKERECGGEKGGFCGDRSRERGTGGGGGSIRSSKERSCRGGIGREEIGGRRENCFVGTFERRKRREKEKNQELVQQVKNRNKRGDSFLKKYRVNKAQGSGHGKKMCSNV